MSSLVCLLSLGQGISRAEAPAVGDLFAHAQFKEVTISPDGTRVATRSYARGFDSLVIVTLADRTATRVDTGALGNVETYEWIDDRSIVIQHSRNNFTRALLYLDVDSLNTRQITSYMAESPSLSLDYLGMPTPLCPRQSTPEPDCAADNNSPRLLLLAGYGRFPDIYAWPVPEPQAANEQAREESDGGLEIELDKVLHDHRVGSRFLLDGEGVARVAWLYDDNEFVLKFFDGASQRWRDWISIPIDDMERLLPLRLSPDGQRMLTATDFEFETLRLCWMVLGDAPPGDCLVASEDFDISGYLADPADNRPLLAYVDTERTHAIAIDDSLAPVQRALERQFPGDSVIITSISQDHRRMIVLRQADTEPGLFYLFDRDGPRLELLFSALEKDLRGSLATTEPVTFRASDGMRLHGYLTEPREGNRPHPLVVLIHGGPQVRDTWSFDPRVQLLATRGFAVLQPNYRLSSGYGKRYLAAGLKRTGSRVQDDIADAVRWAIAEGIADPTRVCAMGASFGGFSTMAQLTRHPELYRCGITIAGFADIDALLENDKERWFFDLQKSVYGSPWSDADLINRQSPINNLESLLAPVLIIHGGKDPRLPIAMAETLEAALKRAGKAVETIYLAGEGHGIWKTRNRIRTYSRVLEFLRENTRHGQNMPASGTD